MSKRRPCPICGAVHNYALMRVIVRLEQALRCAVPQMEEWYLAGYEFLRKQYLMSESENPGFSDRIARSIGAAQTALRASLVAAVPQTVRLLAQGNCSSEKRPARKTGTLKTASGPVIGVERSSR
jgi:hypothetical protein